MSAVTQAVILAGGRGTRLGDLTRDTPKPLLPVLGEPFISILIRQLARAGISDVIISTGYLAEAFDAFLGARSWNDPYGSPIRVTLCAEPEPAGTAGALTYVRDRLDAAFLLVNGDSYLDCDLAPLLRQGAALEAGEALMAVRYVADAARFGRLQRDSDGLVEQFLEKGGAGGGLINAGYCVLTREIADSIQTLPCSIEQEIYPVLAQSRQLLSVERAGYFIDIGLPETYERAGAELENVLSKPALFLDRDGVINIDHGYTHRPEDLKFIDGAPEAIAMARAAGRLVIVISNQAGVARGLYDEAAVTRFHRHLNNELLRQGAWIDAFYYCPYHPEGVVEAYRKDSPDRKPAPGMLLRAAREHNVRMRESAFIGDNDSDMRAGEAASVQSIQFLGGRLDELVNGVLSNEE